MNRIRLIFAIPLIFIGMTVCSDKNLLKTQSAKYAISAHNSLVPVPPIKRGSFFDTANLPLLSPERRAVSPFKIVTNKSNQTGQECTATNQETVSITDQSPSAQQIFSTLRNNFERAKENYLNLINDIQVSQHELMKQINVNRNTSDYLSLENLATVIDHRNKYITQLTHQVRKLNKNMQRSITFDPLNPKDQDVKSDYEFINEFTKNTETLRTDLTAALQTPIKDIYTPERSSDKSCCVIS